LIDSKATGVELHQPVQCQGHTFYTLQ